MKSPIRYGQKPDLTTKAQRHKEARRKTDLTTKTQSGLKERFFAEFTLSGVEGFRMTDMDSRLRGNDSGGAGMTDGRPAPRSGSGAGLIAPKNNLCLSVVSKSFFVPLCLCGWACWSVGESGLRKK